jgi:hypothetical protein
MRGRWRRLRQLGDAEQNCKNSDATPALHKTAAKMDAGRTLRQRREECGTLKS